MFGGIRKFFAPKIEVLSPRSCYNKIMLPTKSRYQQDFAIRGVCIDPNPQKASVHTTGSMIEYSFNVPCNKSDPKAEINRVYLFEAPIDLLSHATIAKIVGEQKGDREDCWKRQNRLALLGVSDVALQAYLSRNPSINEIVCCLDSDSAGREGAKNILQKYGDRYKVSVHTPKNSKDYNEVLCNYIQQQKTVTQSDNIDNDVTYNKTSARR